MRMISPQLDVDDLTAIIRESMAAQKKPTNAAAAPAVSPEVPGEPNHPTLKLQPDFQPHANDHYHVNDLLRYHDRAFVEAAHRAILKRPPDQAEFLRDLKRLRTGYFNKIDLLADLRFSTEGKAKNVHVDGLLVPAIVRRLGQLPLVGYPVRLAIALVRLPNLLRDQREFAGYVLAQNQEMADFINLTSVRLMEQSAERFAQVRAEQQATAERQEETARRQEMFESVAGTRLDDLREGFFKEIAGVRFRIGDVADQQLDTLYVALEDQFRGTREEIKERFKEYLPYVKESAPVIDLGCGRGEWLDLLRESGIEARGVDSNQIQVEQCRARGLDVTEGDFLVHLQSMAAESVGAITGFHIIEHLSFNALVALLNEVKRVLRPGGIVIFETPNPENVVVGSHYFYLDPTHRHPLPSELMEFVFKHQGFGEIEVLNLHPWDSGRVAGEGQLAERFNGYFYGPMDYAIVGRKVAQ
jgi:SAM-dependent methyltransferase